MNITRGGMTPLHFLSFPCLTRESIAGARDCMDAGSHPRETDVRISQGMPGDDEKPGIFILTRGFLNKYCNKNVLRNSFTAQTTG